MVDFTVPDETRLIVDAIGTFVKREVEPERTRLGPLLADERDSLTREGLMRPEIVEALRRIRKKSADAGYYAMHMPESVGGAGVSKVTT